MTGAVPTDEPQRRPSRRGLLLAAALLLAYGVWTVGFCAEDTWRPEWDGALYLLTSKSLAAGEGYTYLGEPFFLRPPGFAWLLAHSLPSASFDASACGGLNRGLLVTSALAVVALWLCLLGGKHRRIALPVALLTGTAALWVRNFNWVLSEFPFLAVLFLALAALHRAARRERDWWIWSVVGAVGLAGAFYLRSMALLVLPALVFSGWTRDRGRQHWRALLPVGLALLLAAPWIVHSRAVAADAHVPSDQLLLHDYATATLRVDPGDPGSAFVSAGDLRERVARNGRAIAADVAHTLVGSRSVLWSSVVAAFVLLGAVVSVRRGFDLLDGFFVVYLALTLGYFTYDERLLVPLVPHLYLYPLTLLATAGDALARRFAGAREERAREWSRGLLLPAAAVVLFAAVSARRFEGATDARSWEVGPGVTLGQSWDDLERAAEWIEAETPPAARVLCNRAPMLGILTGRACYTYRFIRDEAFFARYPTGFVVFDTSAPPQLRQFLRQRAVEQQVLESAIPGNGIEVLRLRN